MHMLYVFNYYFSMWFKRKQLSCPYKTSFLQPLDILHLLKIQELLSVFWYKLNNPTIWFKNSDKTKQINQIRPPIIFRQLGIT